MNLLDEPWLPVRDAGNHRHWIALQRYRSEHINLGKTPFAHHSTSSWGGTTGRKFQRIARLPSISDISAISSLPCRQ